MRKFLSNEVLNAGVGIKLLPSYSPQTRPLYSIESVTRGGEFQTVDTSTLGSGLFFFTSKYSTIAPLSKPKAQIFLKSRRNGTYICF